MTAREILDNGTAVCVGGGHSFGADSLLLARFAAVRPADRLLDIGAGCGILFLALRDAGHRGHVAALELDAEACALMRRSAAENSIDGCEIVQCDLRRYSSAVKFDSAVCNPPYFARGAGAASVRDADELARRDGGCTAFDALGCAARSLKERAAISICWRPERLAALMAACAAQSFAPKRLCFVRHSPAEAPWLALLEASYRGGEGLNIMPDVIAP